MKLGARRTKPESRIQNPRWALRESVEWECRSKYKITESRGGGPLGLGNTKGRVKHKVQNPEPRTRAREYRER